MRDFGAGEVDFRAEEGLTAPLVLAAVETGAAPLVEAGLAFTSRAGFFNECEVGCAGAALLAA